MCQSVQHTESRCATTGFDAGNIGLTQSSALSQLCLGEPEFQPSFADGVGELDSQPYYHLRPNAESPPGLQSEK